MNDLKKQNIWIVDDDASVRQALHRLLKYHGFNVKAFSSGAEISARSANMNAVSCLILDIAMPGENGLEVYDRIQKSGCHAPAVFMTAHMNSPQAGMAKKNGENILRKPFDDTAILNAISQAVDQA